MPAIHIGLGAPTPGQKVFRFRSRILKTYTEFFPERGMISMLYESQGVEEFRRFSVREFVLRAQAISDAARRRSHHKDYADERKDLLDLVEMMIDVAKEARHQGDPLNPAVLRQMKNLALPSRVSMNGTVKDHRLDLPTLTREGVGTVAASELASDAKKILLYPGDTTAPSPTPAGPTES